MSYRPIADVWILARPKVKYYGAYPNGFLERAVPMIGANTQFDVLHLCGGRVKDYPNRRLVERARTVDIDPATRPDFLLDLNDERATLDLLQAHGPWHSVLIDPPHTEADHAKYSTGGAPLPTVVTRARHGLVTVPIDGADYVLADIGLRMLSPRELARAQGFPDSYVLEGTQEQQIARIGNSVVPQVAAAIVRANIGREAAVA